MNKAPAGGANAASKKKSKTKGQYRQELSE